MWLQAKNVFASDETLIKSALVILDHLLIMSGKSRHFNISVRLAFVLMKFTADNYLVWSIAVHRRKQRGAGRRTACDFCDLELRGQRHFVSFRFDIGYQPVVIIGGHRTYIRIWKAGAILIENSGKLTALIMTGAIGVEMRRCLQIRNNDNPGEHYHAEYNYTSHIDSACWKLSGLFVKRVKKSYSFFVTRVSLEKF